MTEITIAPTAERADADASAAVPPHAPGAALGEARPPGRDVQRRGMDPLFGVRTADIEPYTGLRYLSKLFRMIAVVLVILLIAEVTTGLYHDGVAALSTLLGEVSRLIVLAGLLWGVGDLAILLIDVGHDVRAARILIGRQTAHLTHHPHEAHVAGPSTAGAPAAPRDHDVSSAV
ncbi:hypothetical protein tb265_34920 [Gemmatimonadetes bacterium T265]|nr:hypothetical protein tb265_34920 [Gemmatimonadetes bacterium T265]